MLPCYCSVQLMTRVEEQRGVYDVGCESACAVCVLDGGFLQRSTM